MADPDLNESAWQRAVSEVARIYPTTTFEVGATLMTIIFGAIAAVAAAGDNTTTQIAVPIIGGALALLLTFGAVFAVQFAAAPTRQRNELRRAVPDLGAVNVDLTLRNVHRRGNELAQRLENRTSVTTAQREEAEAWTDEVVAFLTMHAAEPVGQQFIAAGGNESKTLPRLRSRVNTLERLIEEAGSSPVAGG